MPAVTNRVNPTYCSPAKADPHDAYRTTPLMASSEMDRGCQRRYRTELAKAPGRAIERSSGALHPRRFVALAAQQHRSKRSAVNPIPFAVLLKVNVEDAAPSEHCSVLERAFTGALLGKQHSLSSSMELSQEAT